MDGQGASGAPVADWYPDPCGRHEVRYWDGSVWTDNVADAGQAAVDPVGAQPVTAAGGETLLLMLPRVSDITWGGMQNLYLTNLRLVVEPVLTTGAVLGSVAAGGLVGGKIAADHAEQKHAEKVGGRWRSIDEILYTTNGAYAINYGDIAELVLTRKALPIGHSRCKVRSANKNVTMAFKREEFDTVAGVLAGLLPGRAVVK